MVEQFVKVVRKYLALVDGLPTPTTRDFLYQCALLLPQIYHLGQQLPDVELPEKDPPEEETEGVQQPMGRIMKVVGKYDLYAEVFDPVFDTEAIKATLSDDLSDIYIDLKRPLIKYESGDEAHQRLAIWEWKFNLQGHCGDHLVDALRPIHRLVYDHLDPEYHGADDA